VVKPVEPRVLVARINALLRRRKMQNGTEHKTLRFGALTIDTAARAVTLEGRFVALTSNEFDLLYALATKAGEIQSRESLYLQLYKREYDGLDRTLDVRISHLRKKLGDAAASKIRTVWGHGYLFGADGWWPGGAGVRLRAGDWSQKGTPRRAFFLTANRFSTPWRDTSFKSTYSSSQRWRR